MAASTDRLVVVSVDSHATVPPSRWAEYLEARHHQHLPRLQEETDLYVRATWGLGTSTMTPESLADHSGNGGWRGVHDRDVRIAQMDREGVAAELVYHGDLRVNDLAHNVSNGTWPFEVWDAGAHAYNRWAHDEFGSEPDRLMLVGAIDSCTDLDATIAEIRTIADRGFVGTFMPGFLRHRDMPPLFDPYWEPLWAECAGLGIALVVHAGFGFEQGEVYDAMARVDREVAAVNGTEADFLQRMGSEVFVDFFSDIKSRRPMWQMMFGGVFDRHPDLKLLLSEIRLDWIPSLLGHLDAIYDEQRDALPATRRPSDYWRSNCAAGASFVHKAEVEMRDEIGVETILFGRDYPHPEGTWPNTPDWIRDAFGGVPEAEARLMLGENAIRFLGRDAAPLVAVAERIGPNLADVIGPGPGVDPGLVANFDARGGYLRPAEGPARIPQLVPMIDEDLGRVRAGA